MPTNYANLGDKSGGDPTLCQCGCGNPAPISKRTDSRKGWVKGQPQRFISGHNARVQTRRITHGHARGQRGTPTYVSWQGMIARCVCPTSRTYKRYGARGIRVCVRWRQFANFLADMGERPDGLTLDRIDNKGNYEPGNCRWATPKEQARHFVKTHCKHGHPLAGDNLEYEAGGQRKCRTCKAAAKRRYKIRQRELERVAA